MSRLTIPTREAAPAASQPLLDAVEKSLGVVPNLFRLVGQSPAALEGLLGLNGALGRALDPATRERIALAVAQVNGCDYCGGSSDRRADAAVAFAAKVASERGRVSDADIAAVKLAGYSEAQIVEIVGLVAVNVYTNFVNNVADTEIDFPVVRAAAA